MRAPLSSCRSFCFGGLLFLVWFVIIEAFLPPASFSRQMSSNTRIIRSASSQDDQHQSEIKHQPTSRPSRKLGRKFQLPQLGKTESKLTTDEKKQVDITSLAGMIMASLDPSPFKRGLGGMGINPTPPNFLSMYGPYIFTLLFLTFGMRGLEPLKRFVYDRQKRRKQAKKMAQKPKKKNAYYRQPSRLYDTMKAKIEQAQEGAKAAGEAAVEGEEEEGEEVEVEEEEAPLSAYRCEICSFTIYPARGREFKFFPPGFKCPSCGATKDKFYDVTDPDDPRNQEDAPIVELVEDGEVDDFELDDGSFSLDDVNSSTPATYLGDPSSFPVEPNAEEQPFPPPFYPPSTPPPPPSGRMSRNSDDRDRDGERY